ncbi:MAG: hypothetical protein CM15mP74_15130 [Halieaceae bacterium]|nr:MAG: hypothetical protein CM15mP74_15130 [Halieaceae bacterium]
MSEVVEGAGARVWHLALYLFLFPSDRRTVHGLLISCGDGEAVSAH